MKSDFLSWLRMRAKTKQPMQSTPYERVDKYTQGRAALYRAVKQGNTYPLLGIADHAYWYARWKDIMKERVWPNPASDRCAECGQSVPVKVQPVFKAGDIVESYAYGQYRIGVIPSRGADKAIRESYRCDSAHKVGFIALDNGQFCRRDVDDVQVVHGYVHIDREGNRFDA